MARTPAPFLFFRVDSSLETEASSFHQKAANSAEYILRRSPIEFSTILDNGEVYGVRQTETRQLCGLCCLAAPEHGEYELGGLLVNSSLRRQGIAHALARVAIAHTVVSRRPWFECETIAAYVDEENKEVQQQMKNFGFIVPKEGMSYVQFGTTYQKFVFPRGSVVYWPRNFVLTS